MTSKNKIFLLSALCFLLCYNALAQGGWKWAARMGDEIDNPTEIARDIHLDRWGNVYVGGVVNDQFVRDSAGNITYDSNFVPILYNYGNLDLWIAKYSPSGKKLWQQYAGSGNEDFYGGMQVDQDGNVYVYGRLSYNFYRPAHSFDHRPVPNDSLNDFIAKLDSSGKLLWHKTFGYDSLNNSPASFGGQIKIINEKTHSFSLFLESGDKQLIFNADTIAEGLSIVRFDFNGNFIDSKRMPFKDYYSIPSNLHFDMDETGNYYFIARVGRDSLFIGKDTILRDTANFGNAFVVAFDSSANLKWYFQSHNIFDPARAGAVFGDTVFVAVDITSFSVDTVYFDQLKYKTNSKTTQESAILLFDSQSGNLLGLRHNNGTYDMNSDAFTIKANSNYFAIGGKFNEKMTFSGTNNYMEAVSKSQNTNSDSYFALFDRAGNYLCEDKLYTYGFVDGVIAMTFKDSSIYMTGIFNDTLYVAGDTLIALGKNDIFVARYDLPCAKKISVGLADNFIKAENGVLLYPNPGRGFTNLLGKPISSNALLYDSKGKLIKSFRLDKNAIQQQLPLYQLKAGIYFLNIVSKSAKQSLKLVIK